MYYYSIITFFKSSIIPSQDNYLQYTCMVWGKRSLHYPRTFYQIWKQYRRLFCHTVSFLSYCEAALKSEKAGSTDTVVPSADIYQLRHYIGLMWSKGIQQTCAAKIWGTSTLYIHWLKPLPGWHTRGPWYNYVHACTYSYIHYYMYI